MVDLKNNPVFIKELINVRPNIETWVNTYTTNCYAYALGLDVPESDICKNAYYIVGTLGGFVSDTYTFVLPNIMSRLELDLKYLELEYEFVNPYSNIKENEWLIAVFSNIYNDSDFHFLRKDFENYWTHKPGWRRNPCNCDSEMQIIKDIDNAKLYRYKYEKCLKLHK